MLLEVQKELELKREIVIELTQEIESLQQQLLTSGHKASIRRQREDNIIELWHTSCQHAVIDS